MAIVTLAFTGLAAGSLPAGSGILIPASRAWTARR